MSLTNVSKPTTTLANTTRPTTGLIWDDASMTWAAQSDTWDGTASLIDNASRIFGGLLWSASNLPWQMTAPWVDAGGITNVTRPA
jgi:hypothetical protein